MPNSLQSSAIASPASRRATNCSLSSITEHSFQGITPSPSTGRKCHLCVRYNVLPMSQVAHPDKIENVPSVPPFRHSHVAATQQEWVLLAALNGCLMRTSFPALSVSGTAFSRGIQKGERP